MSEKHHYKGLTDAQVVESRQKYGENTFTAVEGEPLWKQFLEKFTDPIIIILLVALVFSFGVSFYEYTLSKKLTNNLKSSIRSMMIFTTRSFVMSVLPKC